MYKAEIKSENGSKVKSEENGVIESEGNVFEVKNGDSCHISSAMVEEEEKLLEARKKEEAEEETEPKKPTVLNDSHFTRLDELLTQTQLYSEFLLEKMDEITLNGVEHESESAEKKKVVEGKEKLLAILEKPKGLFLRMLTRSKDAENTEDGDLTEEEKVEEQRELVPLLTGGKLKS